MAEPDTDARPKNDEFSKIFDEYRAKIEEITRRTGRTLQNIEATPDIVEDNTERTFHNVDVIHDIVKDSDDEPTVVIISDDQQDATNGHIEVKWQSDKDTSKTIKEAGQKAQQIIHEAEERVKKEAKKKTQSQVDKIIGKARKESEDIVARAVQEAEKEGNEIVAASKREAEHLIEDITEKYREETRAQSSQVIAEARQTAEKMLADIVTSSSEISQLVINIVNRAKNTVHELENSLQAETEELAKVITDTQKKLEQVAAVTVERNESKVAPANKNNLSDNDNTVIFVKLAGDKSNSSHGGNLLFKGQMELKAVSSFEYKQVKNIKNNLIKTHGIKYAQEYASEKEMSVLFEVEEPLPLLNILTSLPLVDEVISEDDGISLILKNLQ